MHGFTLPLILLTNDDGVLSPGLGAAAAALDPLGELLIAAPLEQQTGMGRSMPYANDGRITEITITREGKSWPGYGVQASPAQTVLHALLELAPRQPTLAVAGINYGANVSTSVTISGTIGAALEAAAYGVPALAVSLETEQSAHLVLDGSIDLTAAAFFTRFFAERMLAIQPPADLDVLKVEIPRNANPQTPWRVTRLERKPFYVAIAPRRRSFEELGRLDYGQVDPESLSGRDTDAAAIVEGVVAVTPLSLDMTSRLDMQALQRLLGGQSWA